MRIQISGIEFIIECQSPVLLDHCRNYYYSYVDCCSEPEHSLVISVRIESELINIREISPKLGFCIKKDGYTLSLQDGFHGEQTRARLDKELSRCEVCMHFFCPNSIDLILSVLWRIVSACKGAMLLHASTFLHKGSSFVCCAHSGGGKNTFLDLLGLPALTDEMSCIKCSKDSRMPMYTTIPWRSLTKANSTYPLGMICILDKASKAYIQRIPDDIAAIYLRRYLYFNFWLQDSKGKVDEIIESIVQEIPIVRFGFNLDTSRREVIDLLSPNVESGGFVRKE